MYPPFMDFRPDWSLYDRTSMSNPAAYAASKGGLIQPRWLATTMAPKFVLMRSPRWSSETSPSPLLIPMRLELL